VLKVLVIPNFTFLKHLKELVQKLKREQKLNQSISKTSQTSTPALWAGQKMHSNFGSNLKN
jgi:late competence protein required for DNA uptake (superfamily II DNA/RNA helicase)